MPLSQGNLVFVLLLVQVATILLAMLGELLFMGGLPLYAIAPLARTVLLLVFGVLALRLYRPALIALILLEALSLAGFVLSIVVGVLPQLDFTPTLTGLVTTLLLPAVVIFYCSRLLTAQSRAAA